MNEIEYYQYLVYSIAVERPSKRERVRLEIRGAGLRSLVAFLKETFGMLERTFGWLTQETTYCTYHPTECQGLA